MLTDEEIQKILIQFASGRGDKGFTEEEAVIVIHKVGMLAIDGALFDLIMRGLVILDLESGELKCASNRTIEDEEMSLPKNSAFTLG